MKASRPYTQTARAEAAERTRLRILDATIELATTTLIPQISLEDVATAAGVSVQTVLRRFGSRDGLLEAAHEHGVRTVEAERRAPVGDVAAAVSVVVDHYEHRGDSVVLMLAQEGTDPHVARVVARGRDVHRAWVEEVLGPLSDGAAADGREASLDLLAVATDVLTWKQLRRDRGLDRPTTEARMRTLVSAVVSIPAAPIPAAPLPAALRPAGTTSPTPEP